MARSSIILFILGIIFIFISVIDFQPFYMRPILFVLGIAMVILSFIFIRKSTESDFVYIDKKNKDRINKIKNNGQKILVDFNSCEIISNKYNKTKYLSRSKNIQIYNSLFDSKKGIQNVEVSICKLKFKSSVEYNGYAFISEEILIDLDTLKIKMFLAKNTYLYVNKFNINEYYFDLSFIQN